MKNTALLALILILTLSVNAQTHSWSKTLRGKGSDEVFATKYDIYGNVYVAGRFQ